MSAKDSDVRKEFGQRLRDLRFALGEEDPRTGKLEPISQEEMAIRLGVEPDAYQKNESKGIMPKLEALQKLVTTGICGPGYLLWPDSPQHMQARIDRAQRENRQPPLRRSKSRVSC